MIGSLREMISAGYRGGERCLCDGDTRVILGDLLHGTILGGRLDALCGRSVLIATQRQLTAALALVELDGVARRLVLCTPDLAAEHVPGVMATAAVDAIVSDLDTSPIGSSAIERLVPQSLGVAQAGCQPPRDQATEWILLTSGTTGAPKLVMHTLSTLTGAIGLGRAGGSPPIWGTFYDTRRYGGLQVLLRALIDGGSLALSGGQELLSDYLARAGAHGVTHITGTPSHWRRALMSPAARRIAPRYIRLSGEIADQAILDSLQAFYPNAAVVHAFATTEAGVAFEVDDGLMGFPANLIDREDTPVQIKIEDGSLRIRSGRTALGYLSDQLLGDENGFVDTGDMVERRGNRYYFVGRRDGVINVGGLKVHPEEVEAVINCHPQVRMSRVRARKNPITGAVVVAEVQLRSQQGQAGPKVDALEEEILSTCRRALASHKVPVAISFVSSLEVAASGKLVRVVS